MSDGTRRQEVLMLICSQAKPASTRHSSAEGSIMTIDNKERE